MYVFIIVACVLCLLVAVAAFVYYHIAKKRCKKFVFKNSVSLKRLKELNGKYIFYPYNANLNQSHTYDNENNFDDVSCEDYLIYQLQFIKTQVVDEINKMRSNGRKYDGYLREVEKIEEYGQFLLPTEKLNCAKLAKVERALFKEYKLPEPVTRYYLVVRLYCSKINSEVYRSKSKSFYDDEILALIKRLNDKRRTYFNDREIWEALCRVERGKVSNKLRFLIYDRDGHRCRKCGISDRYAHLEIDHIIPISKGGKSTYDNLQTLCHKCNAEKGNRIERY